MLGLDSWVGGVSASNEKVVEQDEYGPVAGTVPPLAPDTVRLAYRLRTPCCVRHSLTSNCSAECVASPWCLTGLVTLSTDDSTLRDFVTDLLGNDPAAELPSLSHELGKCATTAGSSPKDSYRYLLRRGIRNLGNTCYLNAVIQMLFHIPAVRDEVLRALASPAVANHKSTKGTPKLVKSGLGELFAEMAYSRDGKGVDATRFASFLSIDKDTQQDAQEFFALLINWLQGEVGDVVRRVFEGTFLYDRECSSCGRSSKRAEPFSFISFPVRRSVEEALEELLSMHEVQGFKCEECGATASALSRLYIRTLPEVFIVHFNRFSFNLQLQERQKITRSVSFPIEWDLGKYRNRWKRVPRQPVDSDCSAAGMVAECDSSPDHLYRLVGVLNHHGEAAVCGHYTYQGRMEGHGGWYQFDDSTVTKLQRFQGSRTSSREAYMLVYERYTPQTSGGLAGGQNQSSVASAANIILPPKLERHVRRLNHEVEKTRQAWEFQRNVVTSFLKQWKDVANDVFHHSSRQKSHLATSAGVCEDLAEYVAFPTQWLKLFGRCFIPSSIDPKRYNSGDRRRKRHRRGTSGLASSPGDDTAVTGSNEKDCGESFSSIDGEVAHDVTEGETLVDCTLIESIYKSTLTDCLKDMKCPHGKLAPWGQYKLMSVTAARRVNDFLSHIPSLLSPMATSGELSPFRGWKLSEYICDACVRNMSVKVMCLKTSWEEDKTIQTIINRTSTVVEYERSEEQVYIDVHIIEHWKQLVKSFEKFQHVVKQQGFTGLVVAMKAMREGGDAEVIPLPAPSKFLCEHKLLSPFAVVREVPVSVWHLLKKRILQMFYGVGVSTSYTPSAGVKAHVDELLPYLPVNRTTKCRGCIQEGVRDAVERHDTKMERLSEVKRFPTVLEAARVMLLSSVEVRVRHPNTLLWKRDIKRLYQKHHRTWVREQDKKIAALEARIAAMKKKEGQGGEGQKVLPLGKPTCVDKRPQECIIIDEECSLSSDAVDIRSPLQAACDELDALRGVEPPDASCAYGCIPAWWVMRWYDWCSHCTDSTVAPPPHIDYSAFYCRHGGMLLPPASLNPTDAFWSKTFSSGPVLQVWRNQLVNSSMLSVVEKSGSARLPPIVLLPLKEMISVLEKYGGEEALLPEVTDSRDLACRVNTNKVPLFVERKGERAFEPPTCEVCSNALVTRVVELSRGFMDGTLRLRLHLRCSKRQHYNATDTLRGVSYNMTVAKLKVEISRRVLEFHGYILPTNEMVLLRGRKPLVPAKARKGELQTVTDGNSIDNDSTVHMNSKDCAEGKIRAEPCVVDEESYTLFDCGLLDGDEVTVNASRIPLEKVLIDNDLDFEEKSGPSQHSVASLEEDVAAFSATRLYGGLDNPRKDDGESTAKMKQCKVCTYLNPQTAELCYMCETAL